MAPIYSSHFCMSSIKPLTGASSCSTNLKWTNNCWFNSCPNWFLLLIRTDLGVCKLFLGTLALAIVWKKNQQISPRNIYSEIATKKLTRSLQSKGPLPKILRCICSSLVFQFYSRFSSIRWWNNNIEWLNQFQMINSMCELLQSNESYEVNQNKSLNIEQFVLCESFWF